MMKVGLFTTTFLNLLSCVIVITLSSCSSKITTKDDMIKILRWQGINDEKILNVIKSVPREEFVDLKYKNRAYEDFEAPINGGDTLDRPFENAIILEALDIKPTSKVLDIGTGSGYQAVLFSKIAKEVYSIEIVPEIAKSAEERIKRLGYHNIKIKTGDGFFGWSTFAPFDAIYVSCSPKKIPERLIKQLSNNGLMLISTGGDEKFQKWGLYRKINGKLKEISTFATTQYSSMKGRAEK